MALVDGAEINAGPLNGPDGGSSSNSSATSGGLQIGPPGGNNLLPLPEDGLGSLNYWREEIQAADDQIDKLLEEWRKNLNRYQNKPLPAKPTEDTIWVPKDYALTERKRPQLWFQLPEIFCQPKPGKAPENAVAPIFAALLNHYLQSPHEYHANVVMTETTFDALCPAGILCSKIGYDAFQDGTSPVMQPVLDESGQPVLDPLTGAPLQEPVEVPNIVAERYRWTRFSPAYLRLPCDWVGSDYDRAPWQGMVFEDDRETIKRRYNLKDEDLPAADQPGESLNAIEDESSQRRNRRTITGVEIFYYTSLFDPTVAHPDRQRQLILLGKKGTESGAVVHRDSPYQTLTPEGKLTADSLIGYPTHIGSLRTISDGKFPNSDVQQTRPQVDELSKFRSTMVRQRARSVPQRVADKGRIDPALQQKLEQGIQQEILLVDGDPNGILVEVARAQYPRENFTANDYVNQDIEECWALGRNQLGLDEGGQTATEASLKQRNTDSRLAVEQSRVKDYFLRGVQKCAILLQRYCNQDDVAKIAGPQAAQLYEQWKRTDVEAEFLWTIKPDAQLRTDLGQERQFRVQAYNQFRRDPLINPQALLSWALEPFGLNPQQFLAPPAPPQEPPPRISVAIKGEDLAPFMPQYGNVKLLLTNDGVVGLDPKQAAPDPMQPPAEMAHGGPQPGVNPVNKRQLDQTGALPGPSSEPNTGGV